MAKTPTTVDPKLLEILVCPVTKGPLEYDAAGQELISRQLGSGLIDLVQFCLEGSV